MKSSLLIFLFLLFPVLVTAQPPKAVKAFDQAVMHYRNNERTKAIASLDKAIALHPEYAKAHVLRGDLYLELGDTVSAIPDYRMAASIDGERYPSAIYSAGHLSFLKADYDTAFKYLSVYVSMFPEPGPRVKYTEARFFLRHAEFAKEAVKRPIELNEVRLSDSINTDADEYANDLSLDATTFFFTRRHAVDAAASTNRRLQENFFMSRFTDGEWQDAVKLPSPVNSPYDDGAIDISADGNLVLFASNRPDGLGTFDLYFCVRQGGQWGPARNLGPTVNTAYWDSQPSLAPDGRTLYFASNRPGGKGKSDIWMSRMNEDGNWSEPTNLGDVINTAYLEMTPVIHPDGRTLYFASESHPGFGKFDLFVSRLQVDGSWTEPVNLGYPLNTSSDEFTFVIHPNGRWAFFSRLDPKKMMEIVRIDLPPYAMPNPITYAKGVIVDDITGDPLEAVFRLVDLNSGDTVIQSYSDKTSGEFLISLPTDRNYGLFVERQGYLFYSGNFLIEGEHPYERPFLLNIRMKRAGEGTLVLRNVFFDVDEFVLKPESFIELSKVVGYMKENPRLKAEVGGHTDNTGTPEHNVTLSQNRARAVYNYLVQQGIATDRLSYRGYGMTRPMDTNDTDEGRANNRRTEINFRKQ